MLVTIPDIKTCKSLEEVKEQSKAIAHMATDILNDPIVQEGYAMSGQSGQTAFINAMNMAKKRLLHYFPGADWTDPLYGRMMSEAKLICAECIKLKYECRQRRTPYNHLDDATARIQKLVRDKYVEYENTLKLLGGPDVDRPKPCNF